MKDWLNIENKVVIVTGGSSGIGEAVVKELLKEGVKVANLDLQNNAFQHENLIFIQTNISKREEVQQSVNKVIQSFGKIDGLVNNAGINIPRLLVDGNKTDNPKELSDNIFDKMVAINLKGCFIVAQIVGRVLVEQKSGVIINMSSESGLEGSEGQSCYAATKAALNSLTRSWAKELGKFNIRVVGVAPGIMEETGLRTQDYEESLSYTRGITVEQLRKSYTNIKTIPLGRSGHLNEVADLVCFYLSDRSSYITGVTTNIAGGKTRG